MGRTLLSDIFEDGQIKNVFVDFFDTIVHRTVHPNQAIRLWAKIMIRELGLELTIDELYFIRKDVSYFLAKKSGLLHFEVDYQALIKEIYNRLYCTAKLNGVSYEKFKQYFEFAEVRSEIDLQYLNSEIRPLLNKLKQKKYSVYIVSDFYTSATVIHDILIHYGLADLVDDVFISSEFGKSKATGELYPHLLEILDIEAPSVVMIGDNKISDIENAEKHGLRAFLIQNNKESKTKKRYLIGSDRKDLRHILRRLYSDCNNKLAPANSDYILFYTVYIERLYHRARNARLANVFFLSREGLFLKRMFDHYQDSLGLLANDRINSHYFKTSRQASMLVSLAEIEPERFPFLRRKYPHLSLESFLRNFTFSKELISMIIADIGLLQKGGEVIMNFLDSDTYLKLKKNTLFRDAYEKNRLGQRKAFQKYLDSFGVDFKKEGMHLADIGWGGSIQQRLYDYFDGKVDVHAYYLGLNEIYDIRKGSERWGLNFSIYPFANYCDHILRGNTELNEQLLSASHGSTLSYNHLDTRVNEFHHDIEKKVFEEHIYGIQEFMFKRYQTLLKELALICYDDDCMQKEMTDYALRAGLFASKQKVAKAMEISQGFYTNVGDFANGLTLSPEKYTKNLGGLVKKIIIAPEQSFRLLLRIKPYLYSKKRYFLAYLVPMWFVYRYIRFNRWLRINQAARFARFKYDYFR